MTEPLVSQAGEPLRPYVSGTQGSEDFHLWTTTGNGLRREVGYGPAIPWELREAPRKIERLEQRIREIEAQHRQEKSDAEARGCFLFVAVTVLAVAALTDHINWPVIDAAVRSVFK
jgi:hypothetical protein